MGQEPRKPLANAERVDVNASSACFERLRFAYETVDAQASHIAAKYAQLSPENQAIFTVELRRIMAERDR